MKSTVRSTICLSARPTLLMLSLVAASACGSPDTLLGAAAEATDGASAAFGAENSGVSKAYATSGSRIVSPEINKSFCVQPKNGSSDNGTPVVLAACNNGAIQVWAHPDATFRISGTKCLDVKDGKNDNGTKLQIWDCSTDNVNQKFTISGTTIKWVNTDKCFDLTDGNANADTPIQLWSCDGGNKNQHWSIQTKADAAAPATSTTNNATSAYLHTSGTNIVDINNKNVQLRGTNIGGWLVTEGWMNGYSDSSDKDPFRFSLETLERRFGAAQAKELINVWYDKFFTAQDLDTIKDMGINTLRVPFGYRNLQNADGSWMRDSAGNIDFTRLDWIVTQAAQRGLYTILVFHIWDSQQASYSQISENTDAGHASLAKAEAIWTEVTKHFKGNASIAAFDVINEPTGSWGNLLQDGLYKAVRAQDNDRMIIMESMSADPATLGWKNVVYSVHEYDMMGNDFGANQSAFWNWQNNSIASFKKFNIPSYIGEFMVQENGPTIDWLLSQYNSAGLHWTSWTYKTVNMGAWGLCNLPSSVHVDLMNDSFDAIKNTWNNIGACTPEAPMVAAFKKALGR